MKRVAKLKICKICERETYRLGRHIKDHNISDKDYYDTYINSIRDLKCSNPDCNKEIKFQNINIGYSQFCSTKCSMVVRNQDPVFKAKLVENMKSYSTSNLSILSRELTLNGRQKSTFISLSLSKGFTKGIFYLMEFPDYIKIGICRFSDDLYHFNRRKWKLKPIGYKLFIGDVTEVANYELKLKDSYTPIMNKEYFSRDFYPEFISQVPSSLMAY